jgi:hypothetical protein
MTGKWDDSAYKQLNKISWDKGRQQNVHQKLLDDIDQLETKKSFKHVFIFATSVALFMFVIYVGFHFFMNEKQIPAVSEEENPVVTDEKEVVIEEKKNLRYFGTIDSSENYYTIAMTDKEANYFIPVDTKADLDVVKKNNFQNAEINGAFGLQVDLVFARTDIPLQSYEIVDKQLHLYFEKADLMKLQGSTGSSMGSFSVYAFASNFKEQVTHYTAYGDGEPFFHGEGFEAINEPIERNDMYFPIITEKGIFLQLQYNYLSLTIEEVLAKFFSHHDLVNAEIDLSMISLETVVESEEKIVVHLNGNLDSVYDKNDFNMENIKDLIAHGVGANLREQTELDQALIYLNEELLFDGFLSHIRINYFDDLVEQLNYAEIDITRQPFEGFFHQKMLEMHKDEENFSYTLVHTEFNVVHEDDAIAVFKEHKKREEKIFIAYFEKQEKEWAWRQTRGAEWKSPVKWSAMHQQPYIYSGAISDKSITKVYAGEEQAKIILVEDNKRFWFAISPILDVDVFYYKEDGTKEKIEQINHEETQD